MPELSQLIQNVDSIDALLSSRQMDTRDFSAWVSELMVNKNLKRNEVIRKSQLNQTFAYQILSGSRHASRDKLIQLAFGMNLNSDEASELLERGGSNGLSTNNRRDLIVAFCLEKHISLVSCDNLLWRYGEDTVSPSTER